MSHRLPFAVVLAMFAVLASAPERASAQRVVVRRAPTRTSARTTTVQRRGYDYTPSRQLSLVVGAFQYDRADDENFPMAALRVDWRLRNWLRSEVGVAYALADLPRTAPVDGDDDFNSSLVAATVGLQAELPIPIVRPYVGIAAGLFGRFDEGDDGASFVRPTVAVPVGARIAISPRLALRGEARWRFDEHEDGRSAPSLERTVGLSFAF